MDIVERLRQASEEIESAELWHKWSDLMREASEEIESLRQKICPTPVAADVAYSCANCEYKPCDFIPQNHSDYCPARR